MSSIATPHLRRDQSNNVIRLLNSVKSRGLVLNVILFTYPLRRSLMMFDHENMLPISSILTFISTNLEIFD